jgi:hypothetical protein
MNPGHDFVGGELHINAADDRVDHKTSTRGQKGNADVTLGNVNDLAIDFSILIRVLERRSDQNTKVTIRRVFKREQTYRMVLRHGRGHTDLEDRLRPLLTSNSTRCKRDWFYFIASFEKTSGEFFGESEADITGTGSVDGEVKLHICMGSRRVSKGGGCVISSPPADVVAR